MGKSAVMLEKRRFEYFQCPDCSIKSYSVGDIDNRYCAKCNKYFHEDVVVNDGDIDSAKIAMSLLLMEIAENLFDWDKEKAIDWAISEMEDRKRKTLDF